ncbi:MAG: hypothetical protein GF320_11920 [Armatimonadia bacterium]|nr:hypothetical protein [Armatimonadia bacterium]
MDYVRGLAEEHLPDDWQELTWSVAKNAVEERWRVRGQAEPRGDPPRRGLGPKVSAEVEIESGGVWFYGQRPASAAEPIRPELTPAEAVQAALDLAGEEEWWAFTREPDLFQWDDWCLVYRVPVESDATSGDIWVDAVTGELRAQSREGGRSATGLSWPDDAHTPFHASRLLAGAGVLLAALVLGGLALRRKQATTHE